MTTPITGTHLAYVQSIFDNIARNYAAEAAAFDPKTNLFDGSMPYLETSHLRVMPNLSIDTGTFQLPGQVILGQPMEVVPSLLVTFSTGIQVTRFLIYPRQHEEVEAQFSAIRYFLPAMREAYIRQHVLPSGTVTPEVAP